MSPLPPAGGRAGCEDERGGTAGSKKQTHACRPPPPQGWDNSLQVYPRNSQPGMGAPAAPSKLLLAVPLAAAAPALASAVLQAAAGSAPASARTAARRSLAAGRLAAVQEAEGGAGAGAARRRGIVQLLGIEEPVRPTVAGVGGRRGRQRAGESAGLAPRVLGGGARLCDRVVIAGFGFGKGGQRPGVLGPMLPSALAVHWLAAAICECGCTRRGVNWPCNRALPRQEPLPREQQYRLLPQAWMGLSFGR